MLMSFPRLYFIMIPYIIWIIFDKAPHTGGRPKRWARYHSIWKYFAGQSFLSRSSVHPLIWDRLLPLQYRKGQLTLSLAEEAKDMS
jgi:hypothetical protein